MQKAMRQAAQLHDHVRRIAPAPDVARQTANTLVGLAGIAARCPSGVPHVVEHMVVSREGARQVDHVGQLRLEYSQASKDRPSAPAARTPSRKAAWPIEPAAARLVRRCSTSWLGVQAGGVADAAEAAAAGARYAPPAPAPTRVAQRQVGMADDAGAGARRAVDAAGAHRRDAVDELGLADRLHLDRPVGAVHRAALDEDRGRDVVAGAGVGQQLVQQVAMVGVIPQMMVRIDDRQVRLEDRLARLFREPCFVGHESAPRPFDRGSLCHRFPLRYAASAGGTCRAGSPCRCRRRLRSPPANRWPAPRAARRGRRRPSRPARRARRRSGHRPGNRDCAARRRSAGPRRAAPGRASHCRTRRCSPPR